MSAAIPMHESIGTEALQRFGWRDGLLWGAAFIVVAGVQIGGFTFISTWKNEAELPGAPPPAVMIELAEIAVAPQVEDIAADVGQLAVAQESSEAVTEVPAEDVPEETPPEDVTPEQVQPVEQVEPEVVETAEVTPPSVEPEAEAIAPDEPDVLEPTEVAEVEPEMVEPIEEVVPDLVETEVAEVFLPAPVQRPENLEEKRRAFAEAAEQKPKKKAEPKPKVVEKKEQAASKVTAPKAVEAEAAEKVAATTTTSTTKRTPKVSPQKWQSQVIALLNRLKKYPADARQRREEGIPRLQFTIDRGGNVLSARIVRSSGFPSLDQAAIEMVNRASPLPAPPESMPQSRITLTVPVNFNLR